MSFAIERLYISPLGEMRWFVIDRVATRAGADKLKKRAEANGGREVRVVEVKQ